MHDNCQPNIKVVANMDVKIEVIDFLDKNHKSANYVTLPDTDESIIVEYFKSPR